LLAASAVAYGGLFLFGLFFADYMVFPAPRPSYAVTAPDLIRLPLTGGGEVVALWLPAPNAKTAILYFHGNAQDLGTVRTRLEYIRANSGCSVLAVDYPGYGLSEGKPSEEGTLRSADAAYGYIHGVRGFSPENIVIWGSSLGSGPSVDLASRRHVKGVILEAPFTSTFRTVTKVKIVPIDRFDNLSKIDRVQSPLLVIHGDRDSVVPFEQGKDLVAAAVNAPVRRFVPVLGAEHNLETDDAQVAVMRAEILKIIGGR
jgi:fermentation-respiration switch protein FrsA (DUF1100 family)